MTNGRKEVLCIGCGGPVPLAGPKAGDRMDCSNCAGLSLRVAEKDGDLALVEVHRVSCPSCEELIEVPSGSEPGETIECCGSDYFLTYEFGVFALVSGVNARLLKET